MLKLSKIKFADATAKDMACALNFAMKKSKKTAQVLTGQLKLNGPVREKHVIKDLYPKDTFSKEGKLNPLSRITFAFEMQDIFKKPKKISEFNLLDYANAVIKYITKNTK